MVMWLECFRGLGITMYMSESQLPSLISLAAVTAVSKKDRKKVNPDGAICPSFYFLKDTGTE